MRKNLSKHVAIATGADLSALTHVMRRATRKTLSLLGAIAVSGPLTIAQSQPGRILSTTTLDVFECNIDSSNCFTVAGHWQNATSRQPSVASNGTIAFNGNLGVDTTYDGNSHIFLMNPDGTNVRQITFNPASHPSRYNGEQWPTISPDGTMIAFLATLNTAPDGSQNDLIYLVNADGSNQRLLTPYVADPNVNKPIGDYSLSYMNGLAWSPDSTKLTFRGTAYTSQCGTSGGMPMVVNVIGVIKADGTGQQILACDKGDGYHGSLDWSPDGTLIAWGRNVSHRAQGCSGCVGEPAIAFLDLSGRNRYSAGITSAKLTTDSCGDPHCIHFSADSSRLAYVDAYPNNGNPCQSGCDVSFINLDGSQQTNTSIQSAAGLSWTPGAAIPVVSRLTLAGSAPNVPPNPVEIWPGFTQSLVPALSDSNGNVIFHSAATYPVSGAYGHRDCLSVGPYGLAFYSNDYNTGTVSATNLGLTSNALPYKCWASPPCTFSLGSASADIPAGGGPNTVNVTADPGTSGSTCPWVAKTSASWITAASGVWGSGNSSVSFNVAANSGAARQGTITIAGISYSVTQDAAAPGPPAIQAITDSWDYVSGLAPGEWVTIVGTNLATGPPRTWNLAGVQQLPTSLGDVSVLFNGTPAAMYYVSPTQVNVLVPATVGPGPVQVIVQSNGTNSAPFTITATATLPSIYALPNANGTTFFVTAALAGTGTLIGTSSVDPRVARAAHAGDALDLYMIGLGATSDGSKFVTNQVFAGAFPISANVTATVGGEQTQVLFAGLTSPGLYLVRIVIPSDLAPGSQPIQLSAGASRTRSSLMLTLQ